MCKDGGEVIIRSEMCVNWCYMYRCSIHGTWWKNDLHEVMMIPQEVKGKW